MRMYAELAGWYPLLSPPEDYDEEAADLLPTLLAPFSAVVAAGGRPTLLELGCGAGSLASHFKPRLEITLTDRSPAMLANSRAVNPECEHIEGDMTSLDLGRTFDIVFVHDAIMYATSPESVQAVMATAFRHCRPGGLAVFVPDFVTETFEAGTDHGGHDGTDGRALRYLEWKWDPNPADHTFEVAYTFLMRDADGSITSDVDRHREGLFRRASWLQWLGDAGFADARSRIDPWKRDVFQARK